MTAVTIQSNKTVLNEVKDNYALLEPSYRKTVENFLANSTAQLWRQRSFPTLPVPQVRHFFLGECSWLDFFHYTLITLQFGKIRLKLPFHFNLSFSKLPWEQTQSAVSACVIAVGGTEGGEHTGREQGLPAWDFSGIDEKKNWESFLSFPPMFFSWPQLLQNNFDETGTQVRATCHPGKSGRQNCTWQSCDIARYVWGGTVLPLSCTHTDRALGISEPSGFPTLFFW